MRGGACRDVACRVQRRSSRVSLLDIDVVTSLPDDSLIIFHFFKINGNRIHHSFHHDRIVVIIIHVLEEYGVGDAVMRKDGIISFGLQVIHAYILASSIADGVFQDIDISHHLHHLRLRQ